MLLFVLTAICLFGWTSSVVSSDAPSKPNVLMIIADDFRPEGRLGLDAHPGGPLFNTPNINKLAGQSVVFDAAFSQAPICGPSRASMLTGFNVDKLRYWSFVSNHWRETGRAWSSLPQYFKKMGYRTVGVGKVFHWDDVYRDDGAYSWNVNIYTGPYSGGERKCGGTANYFCPCSPTDGCVDSNLADEAIKQINTLSNAGNPWFLALGFRRPHMDWNLPATYMRETGIENVSIPMPTNREMDPSIPDQAFYTCDPLLENPSEWTLPQGSHLSDDLTLSVRKYYWSTVRYMDEQLGRVMSFFDSRFPRVAEKTIVLFISDHGWSLGERGLWCKQNLFDDANRVAMMWRVPWLSNAGTRQMRPVSLLDVFPTLIDLAGIRAPGLAGCFGGKAIFSTPADDSGVISAFPRCDAAKGANPYSNPCMNEMPANFKLMGYSLRTKNYRYTEWRKWLGTVADWSNAGLVAVELYDHTGNSLSPADAVRFEIKNVAELPSYERTRANLAAELKARITDPAWAEKCTVTDAPTSRPTISPTLSTLKPTLKPTAAPTGKPTTRSPTAKPTPPLTLAPTTAKPTTKAPTTPAPTARETNSPTTSSPTTPPPTKAPSLPPSSSAPTKTPTLAPLSDVTNAPFTSSPFTKQPTSRSPTIKPTIAPTGGVLPLNPADLAQFQTLYDETNGASWVSCKTSRADPCNIDTNGCNLINHFIVCEVVDQQLRLVELTLPNNRMTGTIPFGLLELDELRIINFSNDQVREENPNANMFIQSGCLQAPRCFDPVVDCSFRNAGITVCDATVTPGQCPTLMKDQCQQVKNVCKWFAGGYGCQSKTFCGFLSRFQVKKPTFAQTKRGITTGAPGCQNIARCRWAKNKCVQRAAAKKAKKVKKRKLISEPSLVLRDV